MSVVAVALSIDALVAVDDCFGMDPGELKARLHAFKSARARLDAAELAAIREMERAGYYTADGAVGTRAWLAHETGAARTVAGRRVHLAKRLRRMPATAAALAAGAITVDHARTMGRGLTPRTAAAFADDEHTLLATAQGLEADDFDKVILAWLRLNDGDGPDPGTGEPSTLDAARHFGGRVRVRADLDLDDGAEYLAELDALSEEEWQAEQAAVEGDPIKERTAAQRRAAAQIEMARRSSATRRDDDEDSEPATGPDHTDADTPASTPDRKRGSPRARLLLVIADLHALAGCSDGLAELEDGTLIPRPVLERWACDSAIGRVVMAGPSVTVNLGRTTRTPSAAQRRALLARDRGCIVPGCKRQARWCEAHHVRPWEHGGPTDLTNLALICRHHHRAIHKRVLLLERVGPQCWHVLRTDGTPLRQRPPPALTAA